MEIQTQYLHNISVSVVTYNIYNELIIKIGQLPPKFVPTENVTTAEKNSKHFALKRTNDKKVITNHTGRIDEL